MLLPVRSGRSIMSNATGSSLASPVFLMILQNEVLSPFYPCVGGLFYLSAPTHPCLLSYWGWSGGAKVLGKLSVPGRPTSLDDSRARAYCACSRCGWGLFGHFSLIYLFSFLSPPLWETARYKLKYCLKGPLNPTQPTNQPILLVISV